MIRPFNKKNQSGFSLVEVLVYLAILVTSMVAIVSLLFSLRQLLDVYRSDQLLTQSARAAMERILYEVRESDAIDTIDPDLVLADSPGHLVLLRGATTTEFYIASSTLWVAVNDVMQGPLTKSDVEVSDLRFYSYDNSVTEAVRVQFTMTATAGNSSSTESFNGAAVIRGSYD